MADNQFTTAVQMEAGAGIPCAGDVRIAKDFTSGLCRILYGLASDYEKRKALSSSMHRLIDGNGAVRIADELIRLLHSDWNPIRQDRIFGSCCEGIESLQVITNKEL